MADQEGPTAIQVSWIPPTLLENITGYRIFYSGGSEDVSGGSKNKHLLTGLRNGDSYSISLVATSQHLPSEHTTAVMVMLGEDMYNTVCGECN